MPLTGGDINKIPPGPGGRARLRAGACRHLHGTTSRPGRPFLPHGICRILTRKKPCLLPPPPPPAWPPPPPCYPAAASSRRAQRLTGSGQRPGPAPRAPRTACRPPSLRHSATWPATGHRGAAAGACRPGLAGRGATAPAPARPRPLAGDRDGRGRVRSRRTAARHRASGHRGQADHRVQPGRAAGPGDPGPGRPPTGRTGSAACGSKRTPPATQACPARSAWTFYAADSPSWPS